APNSIYTFVVADNNTTNGPKGLPVIIGNLTINGNRSIVERSTDANTPFFRLLQVASTATLTINDLTLRNGNVNSPDYQAWPMRYGGAIVNLGGSVTLNRTTFSNNRAYFGGAISNDQ